MRPVTLKPLWGSMRMDLSPSAKLIGRVMRRMRRRARCRSTPADLSRWMNGPALPSMIGTSWESRSISALSMPDPCRAASRCSVVAMRAAPLPMVVARVVSTTCSTRAGITGCPGRSERTKRMPLWAAAGLMVRFTVRPVCRPTPQQLTARFSVC